MFTAMIGPFGWMELIAIGLVGVLLFGRRLPEVGKNIGRGIVEFKKGLAGLDDEPSTPSNRLEDREDQSKTQPATPSERAAQSTSTENQ